MRIKTEHKSLHMNPLKLSFYPEIGPDFMGAAVKEALEQRDAALEEIELLRDHIRHDGHVNQNLSRQVVEARRLARWLVDNAEDVAAGRTKDLNLAWPWLEESEVGDGTR